MKQIIGYKLNGTVTAEQATSFLGIHDTTYANGCFLLSSDVFSIEYARKTKVLDIWFDAVYEEYLIGDYIYIVEDGGNNTTHPKYKIIGRTGDVVRISEFGTTDNIFGYYKVAISDEGHVLRIDQYPQYFRKATPQEISNTTILGYKMEICDNMVRFGCKSYSIDDIIQLYDLMNTYNVEAIKISEGTVRFNHIKKIYSRISR